MNKLTAVELDVLKHLAQGLCCREIAQARGSKQRTVEHQSASIQEKLYARNVTNAVHKAWELDILPGENDEDATG